MAKWRRVDQFVSKVCGRFRKSRQTTIAQLVKGLLVSQQVGQASIARGMDDDTTIKHRVKRVHRFMCNEGVSAWLATRCLVEALLNKHALNIVALDWTDMGEYMLLKASLIFRKRAIPLAWQHVWKWHYHKSQNDEERRFIQALAELIGPQVKWVLLADRGFGRASWFPWLDALGIHYVIRVSGQAWIQHETFTGRIANMPRTPNGGYTLKQVLYRKSHPVTVNVAVHHREPAAEPWYLVTNMDLKAVAAAKLYAKRMGIEEGIRDSKSGLGLKHLSLWHPDRMDRAMILIALSMVLIVLTALEALRSGRKLQLSTSKACGPVLSVFSIGLRLLEQSPGNLRIALRVLHAS